MQNGREVNVRKSLPTKRATLEDVARLAGVGAMTVSRTINEHPYVSEETAKRVRAACRPLPRANLTFVERNCRRACSSRWRPVAGNSDLPDYWIAG